MNIVEFAEEIFGYKLSSFQKEFLTKCYEAYTSNKQLYYIPPRGNSRYSLLFMQYIALKYYFEYAEGHKLKEGLNESSNLSNNT